MARPESEPDDKVVETWETSIAGTIFVWVFDRREDKYHHQAVGGRNGSRRLHIQRDDRKYNQEQIPIEAQHLDPFTNGSLRLISAATRDENLDVRYHFTDGDLAEMLEVRDVDEFMDAARGITSELILRRLYAQAEKIGTTSQIESLRDLINERWPIGGTQKTVREMIEAGERIGAVTPY